MNDNNFKNLRQLKPYEICPGLDGDKKGVIFNTSINPHTIIAGPPGSGKTHTLHNIINNLLNKCNEDEIELYIMQPEKFEFGLYEKYKQVKCCVTGDGNEILNQLKNVEKEMYRRMELFQKMHENHLGSDLKDYNEIYPDEKLKNIYLVIDEFSSFGSVAYRNAAERQLNYEINKIFQRVVSMGASLGIQLIVSCSRTENEFLPSSIKNMCSNRICFRYHDKASARAILGSYCDEINGNKLEDFKGYYLFDGKIKSIKVR